MALLLLSICVVGCLAISQGKDIGRDPYVGYRRRLVHNAPGQGEVIDITYNIVAHEQSDSTPMQDVAAPMTTSGITHQVS